jgi:hypothetical protein
MIDESLRDRWVFVLPEPQLQMQLLNFNRYQSDDERIEFDKLDPTSRNESRIVGGPLAYSIFCIQCRRMKQNKDCGWFFGLFNLLLLLSSMTFFAHQKAGIYR